MNYATFWQRFAAAWIDTFVLFPVTYIGIWVDSYSKTGAFILAIPVTGAYCVYTVYGHGRFGRTIGKYAMGIRLLRITGERVGWREAWLRSSVDIAFAMFQVAALLIALANIPDAEYYGHRWIQRYANIYAYYPPWNWWIQFAGIAWFWSEVVVMLFNEKRRALHDFIAGTVVTADKSRI